MTETETAVRPYKKVGTFCCIACGIDAIIFLICALLFVKDNLQNLFGFILSVSIFALCMGLGWYSYASIYWLEMRFTENGFKVSYRFPHRCKEVFWRDYSFAGSIIAWDDMKLLILAKHPIKPYELSSLPYRVRNNIAMVKIGEIVWIKLDKFVNEQSRDVIIEAVHQNLGEIAVMGER